MKRFGGLFDAIATRENLELGFVKAARGKSTRADVIEFRRELDRNLSELLEQLVRERVCVGDYRTFDIRDPKPRRICAPAFGERVLHHAIMNVVEPCFEKVALFDSYACRHGKGALRAIRRAQQFAREHPHWTSFDVEKFFDSIPHAELVARLAGKFKDRRLLALFEQIIVSYSTSPGRGLPIGALTSQHFANFYLGILDHELCDRRRQQGYVRYMDDAVLFASDGKAARVLWRRIDAFLRAELGLRLKEPLRTGPTYRGFDFLGFRVRPDTIRLSRRARSRLRRRAGNWWADHARGALTDDEAAVRGQAVLSRLEWGDCEGLRAKIFGVA